MAKKEDTKDTVLTIHDFKVMIEGMDMVLGEDWYPTESQWKRIREKLDLIIDSADRPVTHVNTNVALPGAPVDNSILNTFPAELPVAADIPIGEAPPVFQAQEVKLSDGSKGVKTPDIDTSGGYDSGFV